MKLPVTHRNRSSLKVAESVQTEHRDSELVRYHDRGAEADAEGINNTIIDASRHLNLGDFSHFCACALAGATWLCACAQHLLVILSKKNQCKDYFQDSLKSNQRRERPLAAEED
jgi:hypothetical protein